MTADTPARGRGAPGSMVRPPGVRAMEIRPSVRAAAIAVAFILVLSLSGLALLAFGGEVREDGPARVEPGALGDHRHSPRPGQPPPA